MTTEQKKLIESISANLQYPCFDKIEHLDPTHSIDILVLFTLLTSFNKLWRSIGKLRKQRKFSTKLVFPIFSALWAMVRAILQMNDEA
jgi:hypothetical protein